MTLISQRVTGGGIVTNQDMDEWPREGGCKMGASF